MVDLPKSVIDLVRSGNTEMFSAASGVIASGLIADDGDARSVYVALCFARECAKARGDADLGHLFDAVCTRLIEIQANEVENE